MCRVKWGVDMKSISKAARLENLTLMMDFVEESINGDLPASDKLIYTSKLVAEEVLMNIISYAYDGGEGEMRLEYELDGDVITLRFCDSGKAFNPLEKGAVDTSLDIMERQIGGLGIFFVKSYSRDVTYCRRGDENVLTVQLDANQK